MEEQLDVNFKNKKNISLNRRCCYFLVFCVIVLPVITGVVVWYLTDSACDSAKDGDMQSESGTKPTEAVPETTKSPTTISETEPWKNLRLPTSVVPVHYDITLYPNFYGDNGWFYGNETVELSIKQSTKYILIHANFLNITRTELRYTDGQDISIKRTFWYAENQFWVVETVTPVQVSRVFLTLQFDGSLTREIFGFYKSTYVNSETKEER